MHRKAHIVSAEANLAYVEGFLTEDEPLLAARREAAEIGGAPPIGPGGGAALRFIAAAINARSVVEIGTGCGTSGIWLLRGMRPDAVLTSVDAEPEHQRRERHSAIAADPLDVVQTDARTDQVSFRPWSGSIPSPVA